MTYRFTKHVTWAKPSNPGMYLHLYHGRTDPQQDMEDWGTDGPYIGPLATCNVTYLQYFKLAFTDGYATGPGEYLEIVEDMVLYDGIYYGEFILLQI